MTRLALSALFLLSPPLMAATIIVDETTCTLVDAVTAANLDAATGGCPAGSGPDTIELTVDVTLTTVNNHAVDCDNGLPAVMSEITVEGGGFTIDRDAAAPPFRFFAVEANGKLTLNELTLRDGESNDYYHGGAIGNEGILVIENSTLTDNHVPYGWGGAISNCCDGPQTVTLTNVTISDNTAFFYGGAICNMSGTVTLTNSILSGNGANLVGGNLYSHNGDFTVANSIIADAGIGVNCDGPYGIIDGGNTCADDDTCGPGFADITPGVDYDDTLADNGGPTQTHALLPGSVAIDAAGECGLETDQRGEPRDDGACDSGPYEFQKPVDVPATGAVGVGALLIAVLGSGVYLVRRRTAT
jgi:predicted outer membrane repeat protein